MSEEDFYKKVGLDELRDKAEIFGVLKPLEYARLRGVYVQRVYYYIRNHRIAQEYCKCCGTDGLIRVAEADAVFLRKEAPQEAKETRGGLLAQGSSGGDEEEGPGFVL